MVRAAAALLVLLTLASCAEEPAAAPEPGDQAAAGRPAAELLPALPAAEAPRTFPHAGTSITPVTLRGFVERRTPGPGGAAVPASLLRKLPVGPGLANRDGTAAGFELNLVRALVFADGPFDPAAPGQASAAIVLCPGLLGGAADFVALATALVEGGRAAGTPVVVVAMDRRANFLEDATGMAAAFAAKDPAPMNRFHGILGAEPAEVDGRRFEPIEPAEALFVAEWGLDVHLRDLREVIRYAKGLAGEGRPVFLAGHSFGATISGAYAAYDFALPGEPPAPGHAELAGLVFLDGSPAVEQRDEAGKAEARSGFLEGGSGFGGLPGPGLTALRTENNGSLTPYPWLAVPGLLEPVILASVVAAAIGAVHTPEVVAEALLPAQLGNPGIAGTPFFGTYAALLGVALDDDLAPFNAFRFSIGFLEDPAAHARTPAAADAANPTGLYRLIPSTPEAPYRWLGSAELAAAAPDPDFAPAGSSEPSSLITVAQAFALAPGLDFVEQYFPNRLLLDAALVNGLGFDTTLVADGDPENDGGVEVELTRFGDPPLRVTQQAGMALPVLAFRGSDGVYTSGASDAENEAAFRPYAASLPPVHGSSAPRVSDGPGGTAVFGEGFEVQSLTPFTHNDVLTAEPSPAAAAILEFVGRWGG